MAYTFNMIAPAAGFSVTSITGTVYTADGSGLITGVSGADVNSLEGAGCLFAGNVNQLLPLTQFLLSSGQPLPAVASSAILGLNCVPGSSLTLIGEATSSGTNTDYAITEIVLPPGYLVGSPFNIVVNAQWTSSGTTSSTTVVPVVYKTPNTGVQVSSENLTLTSAKTITSSAADYTFLINGNPSSGALTPGSRLLLELKVATVGNVGSNTTWINSVRYQIA